MSDLQARIAAIIDTHTAVGAEGQVTCWCDSQQFDSFHAHSLHAADAVTDLLIDMASQGELLKAMDRMYRPRLVVPQPIKLVQCAYCDYEGTPEELTTQHLNECP
jgi:hypothetical protein